MKRSLVFFLLLCILSISYGQNTVNVLEQIARSLPETEAGWKLINNDSYLHTDGSSQASLRWTNGKTEVGATVILHRTLKTAKKAFEPHDKADPQESFLIKGIGDKAYLWPPKAPEGGAYNLRFRKGKAEVWISGASEEIVKRCADYIAASITPPNKSLHRSRASQFLMVLSFLWPINIRRSAR
jgi:hypothetical protein